MTDFRTPRLTIRAWDEVLDDPNARSLLETRLAAMLTPDVVRHLPPGFGPGGGPKAMARWIETRRKSAQVCLVQHGNKIIGLLFLFTPKEASGLHLGYLLAQDAWGRGYASELVQGLVARLRDGPPVILHAGVAAENPASARVLLKAGFVEDTADIPEGIRHFSCALEKRT